MQLSQNQKIFSEFFSHFQNLYKIWNTLKKICASEVFCLGSYRLQEAAELNYRKSRVSEHLWRVNMFKCPKDFLNLHGSIFVRFFDHS